MLVYLSLILSSPSVCVVSQFHGFLVHTKQEQEGRFSLGALFVDIYCTKTKQAARNSELSRFLRTTLSARRKQVSLNSQ